MHQKAQAQHTFIYIFSVIAAGLVILFGYYVIKEITSLKEESMLVDFRAELLKQLKTIRPDQVEVVKFEMPTKIKEVCFVDISNILDLAQKSGSQPVVSNGLKARHPLIAGSVQSDVDARNIKGENFFLVNDKNVIEISEYIGNIKLGGPNWYCKPVENNRLVLNITGVDDGFAFTKFELVEVIEACDPLTLCKNIELSFDNVIKGLRLEVTQNAYNAGKIKFEINPSGEGISDKFKICYLNQDNVCVSKQNVKLDLFLPLNCDRTTPPTICCTTRTLNFKTGKVVQKDCPVQPVDPKNVIAKYEISET